MLTQWERFIGGPGKPARDRIHVTLNHRNAIRLNRNAYELLGRPEAVVMFYNKVNSAIGLQSAHPKHADAFPIRCFNDGFVIYATAFCKHHQIRTNRRLLFPEADLDSDGILRLDLRKTVSAGWRTYKRPGNKGERGKWQVES